MKNIFYTLAIIASVLLLNSCKKEQLKGNGTVTVEFDHMADNATFALNQSFKNAANEDLTFTKLKYFISNIELLRKDGTTFLMPQKNSYFLIEEATNGANQSIRIPEIPAGEYTKINFMIGVDSLRSVAPVSERTGVLDVNAANQDMYWMWNSGYIFMKAEGTCPQVSASGNMFKYHIGLFGGYSTPTLNNIKKVSLAIPETGIMEVDAEHNPNIHMKVNVLEMFKTPNALSVAQKPVIMVSADSKLVADNYADMFSIHQVE